jgi:hypothetical protein
MGLLGPLQFRFIIGKAIFSGAVARYPLPSVQALL